MNYKKLVIGLLILVIIVFIGWCFWGESNYQYGDFTFELCSINEPYESPRIIKNIITKNFQG